MLSNHRIFKDLLEQTPKPISILSGPPGVGKSTLLEQLGQKAREQGIAASLIRLSNPEESKPWNRYTSLIANHLETIGDVILLDEIQNLNSIHDFVTSVMANPRTRIFATISSADPSVIPADLEHYASLGAVLYTVHPYSLEESGLALSDYIRFGGLPGTVSSGESPESMQEYLENIAYPALIERSKLLTKGESESVIKRMFATFARHQGTIIDSSQIAQEVGIPQSTIELYMQSLINSEILAEIDTYCKKSRNEIRRAKKYFLFDAGLRNAAINNFSPIRNRLDMAQCIEGHTYLELVHELKPNESLKFWRVKKGENIDFIWEKKDKIIPIEIQLKWNVGEITSGLRSFLRSYPETPVAYIVNLDLDDEYKHGNTLIKLVPWEKVYTIPQQIHSL